MAGVFWTGFSSQMPELLERSMLTPLTFCICHLGPGLLLPELKFPLSSPMVMGIGGFPALAEGWSLHTSWAPLTWALPGLTSVTAFDPSPSHVFSHHKQGPL